MLGAGEALSTYRKADPSALPQDDIETQPQWQGTREKECAMVRSVLDAER
jgi:hypothetical protein